MSRLYPECEHCKSILSNESCYECQLAEQRCVTPKVPRQGLILGAKVFVRDNWIEYDWQVPQGEIVEIGYAKNTDHGIVFLLQFPNFKSVWYHRIALKTE